MVEKIERLYTVPLNKAYEYTRTKRARRTVKILKAYLNQHTKAKDVNIRLSNMLNSFIWSRGIEKPPRKVKIKVIKEGEMVKAYLHDEKILEPKKEVKEQTKETKTEQAKDVNVKVEQKSEVKTEAKKEDKKETSAAVKPSKEKALKSAAKEEEK